MKSAALFAVFLLAQMVASEEYKIPFTYQLGAGFIPHTLVTVIAHVPPNAKRFTIDYTDNANTILFHFDSRFTSNTVVMNTMNKGKWQIEEVIKSNPFKKGADFKLEFQCEEDYFKVVLNGKLLRQYKARVHPLYLVKNIQFIHDIILKSVSIAAM
ncbi:galectin-9-like [Bombina bombina]|uniref:galectin-9-like n=1 Tax=Bombina bombina TaxID=8345 RepID=UPI00235A7C66|nr:galectin-9-like [Bombina bombina]